MCPCVKLSFNNFIDDSCVSSMEKAKSEHMTKTQDISVILDSDAYRYGYFNCAAETLRFLVGVDDQKINDGLKNDLFSHLQNYFFSEKIGTNTQGLMKRKVSKSKCNEEPIDMTLKQPRIHKDNNENPAANTCSLLQHILESTSPINHITSTNFDNSIMPTEDVQNQLIVHKDFNEMINFAQWPTNLLLGLCLNIIGKVMSQIEFERICLNVSSQVNPKIENVSGSNVSVVNLPDQLLFRNCL